MDPTLQEALTEISNDVQNLALDIAHVYNDPHMNDEMLEDYARALEITAQRIRMWNKIRVTRGL